MLPIWGQFLNSLQDFLLGAIYVAVMLKRTILGSPLDLTWAQMAPQSDPETLKQRKTKAQEVLHILTLFRGRSRPPFGILFDPLRARFGSVFKQNAFILPHSISSPGSFCDHVQAYLGPWPDNFGSKEAQMGRVNHNDPAIKNISGFRCAPLRFI